VSGEISVRSFCPGQQAFDAARSVGDPPLFAKDALDLSFRRVAGRGWCSGGRSSAWSRWRHSRNGEGRNQHGGGRRESVQEKEQRIVVESSRRLGWEKNGLRRRSKWNPSEMAGASHRNWQMDGGTGDHDDAGVGCRTASKER
jgi:hypothetical protein